nr:MATE family efflux transporter [Fusobacterium gastrosuis]
MQKKINDITEGNILKAIIFFALPLLGSSLIQQLYNTADMIFVGNFVNKQAAAAVGASSLLFTCLIGLLTGVSVGVSIIISQKVGAKEIDRAKDTAHTALLFGLICGALLTLVGFSFADELLKIMNTPEEIFKESVVYLRIYFLSMIPMIIYNMGLGIIRSSGNSKTPFYILIIGGIGNVIANTIFVVILKMGVAGVAIATLLSQGLTAILTISYLFNEHFLVRIEVKKLKIHIDLLKRILYLGLPTGLQSMVVTFSNILVQYSINGYGGDAVAAYATYFKLENLIWMPIVAVGQAITTFSGQNTGAKNYERVKKGTLIGMILASSIAIFIAAMILIFPTTFFRIFIKDTEVINLGVKIVFITFPFYWLYSILETVGGSIRGMGYSLTSMLIIMSSLCGLRIALLLIISRFNLGFQGVAYVYPITWFVAAASFSIAFYVYISERMKNKVV